MGKSYSLDLRERVFGFVAAGRSRRAAARHFAVSASFAVKLSARIARTGSCRPARQGRPPGGGKLMPFRDFLVSHVEAAPDMTMPELAAALAAERGVSAHPASLSRFLRKLGFSNRAMVYPGDLIICHGVVTEKVVENGEELVTCDLWAVNQSGEKVVQPASALVRFSERI